MGNFHPTGGAEFVEGNNKGCKLPFSIVTEEEILKIVTFPKQSCVVTELAYANTIILWN